ncbi:MAG: TonB-dependent receptor plug domain-containing protein, partial [Halioglobus sp.]|nr:TonB-dependent receptor plug domain-containing protein [Halioglobus sp.]
MRYSRALPAAPLITALLSLGPPLAAPAAAAPTMDTGALTDLSFEELMQVEVTSASKRKQPLDDVPAAVFVISRDDLRRSGAGSIPEALRMVPGMQVARLDGNKWSVSARGFASRFANKLLVLIDGRTVYSPAFSGVYWEQQHVVMEDVERIEVIRGPGATLWGANAVNGVVNIITRDSQKTLGGLALAGAGNENRATATLRYGARLGSGDAADTTARGYLTYDRHDDLVTRTGHAAGDAWDMAQGGFRLDSDFASGDWMTVQGDLYHSNLEQQVTLAGLAPPDYMDRYRTAADARGWNLLGRWQRPLTA